MRDKLADMLQTLLSFAWKSYADIDDNQESLNDDVFFVFHRK